LWSGGRDRELDEVFTGIFDLRPMDIDYPLEQETETPDYSINRGTDKPAKS
jgi:hypothetical protein